MISDLAGRRAISLSIMNGWPAKMSTSRFSITRPVNLKRFSSKRMSKLVSPLTLKLVRLHHHHLIHDLALHEFS